MNTKLFCEKNQIFNSNLSIKRREKNLTQKEMSHKLGVKRERYAKYEVSAFPPPSILANICEILSIDDLYLFLVKSLVK